MTFWFNDSNNACLPIPSTFYDMLKFVHTINIAKHNGNDSIEYMKWDNSVSGLLIYIHIWLASAPEVFRTFIFSRKVIFQTAKKSFQLSLVKRRKKLHVNKYWGCSLNTDPLSSTKHIYDNETLERFQTFPVFLTLYSLDSFNKLG